MSSILFFDAVVSSDNPIKHIKQNKSNTESLPKFSHFVTVVRNEKSDYEEDLLGHPMHQIDGLTKKTLETVKQTAKGPTSPQSSSPSSGVL